MPEFDALLLQRAARVRLLALDVDGVLTDGRLYFDRHGNELKAFHTRDGLGLRVLQRCGLTVALITGRSSEMVTARARALGIEHVYQGANDKLSAYHDLLERTGQVDDAVCYAGDDWVDLPLLQRVGLAVAVPDADDAVRDCAHWVTARAGGQGAVRDICNLLLEAQGLRERALAEWAG